MKINQARAYWEEIKNETSDFDLAIVIPAYNEDKRITSTLVLLQEYFSTSNFSYQVIVVDDGSTDQTAEVVTAFANRVTQLEVIKVHPNQGKGWAVRTGALSSRAKLILFCDADGSTPFPEFAKLCAEIEQGADIAIGSRAMRNADVKLMTTWHRKFLGRSFNFFVNSLLLPGFRDTQCGFKLFTAHAGHTLFFLQTRKRFSFDLEVLYLARKLQFKIKETAVNWVNAEGSKVNLVTDSIQMLLDIFKIRWYWLKHWNKS